MNLNGVAIKELERRMRPLRPRKSFLLDSNDDGFSHSRVLDAATANQNSSLAAAARELQKAEREWTFDEEELVRCVDPSELNFVLTLRSMRTPFGYLAPNESLRDVIERDAQTCRQLGGVEPSHFADELERLLVAFTEQYVAPDPSRPIISGEVQCGTTADDAAPVLVRRLKLRRPVRSPFVNLHQPDGPDEQWDENHVLFRPGMTPPCPELHLAGNARCGSVSWIRRFGFFGGNAVNSVFLSHGVVGAAASSANAASAAASAASRGDESRDGGDGGDHDDSKHPVALPKGSRVLNPYRLDPLLLDVFFRGRWSKAALQLRQRQLELHLAGDQAMVLAVQRALHTDRLDLAELNQELDAISQTVVSDADDSQMADAASSIAQEIDEKKGDILYQQSRLKQAQAAANATAKQIKSLAKLIKKM